jgi:plasmid maintenance system antidote protein VapI
MKIETANAEIVKAFMHICKVKQDQLAEVLGITRVAMSNKITGKSKIFPKDVKKLSDYFSVKEEVFYYDDVKKILVIEK